MYTLGVHDPETHTKHFANWLEIHGLGGKLIYRLDIGRRRMRVHSFAQNADGKAFVDPNDKTEAAINAPYTIPVQIAWR